MRPQFWAVAQCHLILGVRFGPPQRVDLGESPDDFRRIFGSDADVPTTVSAVAGREFNILSVDQGMIWTDPSATHFSSVIHRFPSAQDPGCAKGADSSGRICNQRTVGKWLSTSNNTWFQSGQSYSFELTRKGQTYNITAAHGLHSMVFEGLPQPTKCVSQTSCGPRLGGTASVQLPENDAGGFGGWLMTAIVQWEGHAKPLIPNYPSWCRVGPGNRSSIVVFRSLDKDGGRWQFISVLADAKDYPESAEGPNENDLALLADRRTLLAVVRMDAGDGCTDLGRPGDSHMHYLNYHVATSTDFGKSWTKLRPVPNAGCARPRLLLVQPADGSPPVLLLSGGRHRNANTSDISLWVSHDGRGEHWTPFSLSYHHNDGIQEHNLTSLPVFDDRVNKSEAPWHLPRETNAYTSLVQLNPENNGAARAMVLYDWRQPSTFDMGSGRTLANTFAMVVFLNNSALLL